MMLGIGTKRVHKPVGLLCADFRTHPYRITFLRRTQDFQWTRYCSNLQLVRSTVNDYRNQCNLCRIYPEYEIARFDGHNWDPITLTA